MTPEVYRENMIELMVLQALLGTLSTNVKALTLEYVGADVRAHFLLRADSAEDREEIEENLPTEVSVFTNGIPGMGEVVVDPVIHLVGDEPEGFIPPGRRVLHLRD
jgi:hypothetical protein